MENSDSLDQKEFKPIGYAIKIKADLDKRISNHVHALKHLEGRGYSKKRWVQEAIKEKLKTWQQIGSEKIESDRTLNFNISQDTDLEIIKIVKFLKKIKIKTSKTDFILEAIIEKLNREEENTRKIFQNMIKTAYQSQEIYSK